MSVDSEPPLEKPVVPEQRNLFYLVIAYTSAGLGIIGAFLPLLPTTPFLLLAAWAAAKGSPELHRWLYEHPKFGAPLIAWEQKRAVSTRGKWLSCVFMSISWVIMLIQTSGPLVPAITGVIFVCVSAYLITRPTP
jgi:uncharacterized membrane protein YbaN (DUF454 family)